MNRYKYGFDRCKTFAEIRGRKASLSKLLHPDRGGDALLFTEMAAEASERFDELSELPLGGKRNSERSGKGGEDKPDILSELLDAALQSEAVKRKLADGAVNALSGLLKKR